METRNATLPRWARRAQLAHTRVAAFPRRSILAGMGPTSSNAPEVAAAPLETDAKERPSFSLALRWLLALVVLVSVVVLVGQGFRTELEALGRSFVDRFGLLGMALGTFLADGFHCPVPPQFYMLLAIAAGGSQVAALGAVASGSLLGGATGYVVARNVGAMPWVSRLFARSSRVATRIYAAHGTRVILLASITPVAFSMLCYFAGVCRLPPRAFLLIALLRLPKLVAYYYLVRFGWSFV